MTSSSTSPASSSRKPLTIIQILLIVGFGGLIASLLAQWLL